MGMYGIGVTSHNNCPGLLTRATTDRSIKKASKITVRYVGESDGSKLQPDIYTYYVP